MGAVIKKELYSYRRHMLLYLVAAGLMLFIGVRFGNLLFSPEIANIRTVFAETAYGLVLFVPLLTMDTFAAEKHDGTDRLLFSAAINIHGVVFAKFLAAFIVFAAFSLLALLLPMLVMLILGVYWAEVVLFYCGVLLMGGAVCAVGIFFSSLSSHGLRALLVTVAMLFAWWMLDALLPYAGNMLIKQVIYAVSVFSRFREFQYGLLSYSAVFYLLTVIFLFQAGAVQALQLWRQKRS